METNHQEIELKLDLLERNQLADRFFRDDPVFWIERSLSHEDIEVLSFILSGLSYGRVEQIKKSYFSLIQRLSPLGVDSFGGGVSEFLKNKEVFKQGSKPLKKRLQGWRHRLNTSDDVLNILNWLSQVYGSGSSLKAFFQNESIESCLSSLSKNIRQSDTRAKAQRSWSGTGPQWWAPDPKDGSACKRILMWLRWLVRTESPDIGIWNNIRPASDLIVPLDTHVLNWCRKQKILKNNVANWKNAVEVTSYFKKFSPKDPLKYDYLICHEGMSDFRKKLNGPKSIR
jgi:uncharacterized protein (TIGR02757 family)